MSWRGILVLIFSIFFVLCGGGAGGLFYLVRRNQERAAFERVKAETMYQHDAPEAAAAWRCFLDQHPSGAHAEEAKGLLQEHLDYMEFYRLSRSAPLDPAAYARKASDYLARYPEGRYRGQVQSELERLPILQFRRRLEARLEKNPSRDDLHLLALWREGRYVDGSRLLVPTSLADVLLQVPHRDWQKFAFAHGMLPVVYEPEQAGGTGAEPLTLGVRWSLAVESERSVLDSETYMVNGIPAPVSQEQITLKLTVRKDGAVVWTGQFTGTDPRLPSSLTFETWNGMPTSPRGYHTAWHDALEEACAQPVESLRTKYAPLRNPGSSEAPESEFWSACRAWLADSGYQSPAELVASMRAALDKAPEGPVVEEIRSLLR